MLDLDSLVEYWGDKQLTPMVVVDEDNLIVWRNRWADWLFRREVNDIDLGAIQCGAVLADYATMVRKYSEPPVISVSVFGMSFDVEGRIITDKDSKKLMVIKFHTRFLSRASMIEMHKFMQDFALETGDRVNNPLTTVINCLHMIEREIPEDNPTQNWVELAIREAYVMKEFGDWVRRLSEESPSRESFNILEVLKEVLERRDCNDKLSISGDIPNVLGCAEHAGLVLGGLVNLVRQASGSSPFYINISSAERLVLVEMNSINARVKDLRMLSEEFYGGLGLLAARYLLSLMQAQLELEFRGDVGLRVTFIQSH